MAGLFRNNPATPEGKYLLKRRDGSVPEWPFFVIAASDPAAPHALWAYAARAERLGMDREYCRQVQLLGNDFAEWQQEHGQGDPDAPAHRTDDPTTIAEMAKGRGA